MSIRQFFFVGAALAGLSFAASAQAHAPRDPNPPTRVVSYHDLDLSTDSGARELAVRLRQAASEVCDRWTAPFDRPAQEFVRRCMSEAIGDAAAKVNRPTLTAALSMPHTIQLASTSDVARPGRR